MSCFPDLTWPSCNPDDDEGIYQCSETFDQDHPSVDCCLSVQTQDETKSNCPAGWVSHPKLDEWCTDSIGIINPSEYRHKCSRVKCDRGLDPKTNCQTCLNPLLKAPDCIACIDSELQEPACVACKNDSRAPPLCEKCLDPSETVCGVNPGVCVDTNYDERNCGACAGTPQSKQCGASEICDKGECVCGVKFEILAVLAVFAVFEPRFTLILKWTSPKPLAELEGQTIQVLRDKQQNTFIQVSAENTTLAAPVLTTTLELALPAQSPAFYDITLFSQLQTSEKKSTRLRVDFPDYQNNNRTCGGPDTACDPPKWCERGVCRCPDGRTGAACSACSNNGNSFFSDCRLPLSCVNPLENVSTNCQTCNNPRLSNRTGCTTCTNENAFASLNCTRFVFYPPPYTNGSTNSTSTTGITTELFACQKTYGSKPAQPYMQVYADGIVSKAGVVSSTQRVFNRVAGSYDGSRLLAIDAASSSLMLSLHSGESWITLPYAGVTSVAFAVDGKTACAAYCDPQQVTPSNDYGKLLWISFDDNDDYNVVSKPCTMTQVDMYTTLLLIGAVGTRVFMSADLGDAWIECVSSMDNDYPITQVCASFWFVTSGNDFPYDPIYNPVPYQHKVLFGAKTTFNEQRQPNLLNLVQPLLTGSLVEHPVVKKDSLRSVSKFVYKGGLGSATAVASDSLLIMNDGETNFGQTITCLGAAGDGRVYVGTGSYLFTQLVYNGPFYACRVSVPYRCAAWADESRQTLADECALPWVAVSVQSDFVLAATHSQVYYSAGHGLLLKPEALPVLPGKDESGSGVWWQCLGSNASGTMLVGASNGELYRCMNRTWSKLTPPPTFPATAGWFRVVVGPTIMVAVSIDYNPNMRVNYDGTYFEYTLYCSRDMGITWIELYSLDPDYGTRDPNGGLHSNSIQFRGDVFVSNDDLIMTTCEQGKQSGLYINPKPFYLEIRIYNPNLIQHTVQQNQTYCLESILTSATSLSEDYDKYGSKGFTWKVIPSDDFSSLFYMTPEDEFYPCFVTDDFKSCNATQYCNNTTESCVPKTGWKPRITSITTTKKDKIIIEWTDDGRLYDTWNTYLGFLYGNALAGEKPIPDSIYVTSQSNPTGQGKLFTDTLGITSFDYSVYFNRRRTGVSSLDLTTVFTLPSAWISQLGTRLTLQINVLGETSLPINFVLSS
jgi:hypothetical protein